MMMILAGVAFGLFFIFMPAKEYLEFLKVLKAERELNHNYAIFSDLKIMVGLQFSLLVFSVFIIFFTGFPEYMNTGDGTWIGIGIALVGSSIGSIITALNHRRLFYDESGFLLTDHHVLYRSIRNFSKRKSILGVATVETLRGESLTFTNKCAAKLQELAKTKKKLK